MTHFREAMDPKPFLCAHDLKGRAVDIQIDRVVRGKVTGEEGRSTSKPACYFRGTKDERPLFLNVTNCKTIAALTGSPNIEDWAGQWVTLYPTTTRHKGETVECIRIKNRAPRPRDQAPTQKPQAQPGDDRPADPTPTEGGATS